MGKKMWLHCASTLHADSVHYAAYPNGTYFEPDEILPDGRCVFKGRSGELHVLWQDRDTRDEYVRDGIVL